MTDKAEIMVKELEWACEKTCKHPKAGDGLRYEMGVELDIVKRYCLKGYVEGFSDENILNWFNQWQNVDFVNFP